MLALCRMFFLTLITILNAIPAKAQSWNVIGHTNFSDWFTVTEFPNAQASNLSYWQAKAQKTAGWDLWGSYQSRCILSGQKYPELGSSPDGFIAPARVFDSVIFLGYSFVTAWAIETGDGLILIDSLDNPDQIKKILLPGLKQFGYGGSDVKALIITHEHYDHFGGAGYMQSEFSVPIYAAEEAWDVLETIDGTPKRGHIVEDGDQIRVGNTPVNVFKTPGHTNGTISLTFPVYDRGEEHTAGLFGGVGIADGPENKSKQIESFRKFGKIAKKHGVDVLMGNHQGHDFSAQNLDILANRQCNRKGCSLPNPYVVGAEKYGRFLQVMEMCIRVNAAREGEDLRV